MHTAILPRAFSQSPSASSSSSSDDTGSDFFRRLLPNSGSSPYLAADALPRYYGQFLQPSLCEQLKRYPSLLIHTPDTDEPASLSGCSMYASSLACMLLTYIGYGFATGSTQLLLTAWSNQSVSRPVIAQNIMSIIATLAQGFGRIQAHFTRDQEDPGVISYRDKPARRAYFSDLLYRYTSVDAMAVGLLIGAILISMQNNQHYAIILEILGLAHMIQLFSQMRQYGYWYCIKLHYGNREQQATQVAMKHTIDAIEIVMNNFCTSAATYAVYSLGCFYAKDVRSKLLNYSLISALTGAVLSCAPKYLFWWHSQRPEGLAVNTEV